MAATEGLLDMLETWWQKYLHNVNIVYSPKTECDYLQDHCITAYV